MHCTLVLLSCLLFTLINSLVSGISITATVTPIVQFKRSNQNQTAAVELAETRSIIDFPKIGIVVVPETPIDEGSFAHVYKAHSPTIGKDFALKLPKYTPRNLKKLLEEKYGNHQQIWEEAEALKRVKQLLDEAKLPDGRTALAMKWMKGRTLQDIIESGHIKKLRQLMDIQFSIMQALSWVHRQGVSHNDISTNNVKIQVRKHGIKRFMFGKYEAHLIDFGKSTTFDLKKLDIEANSDLNALQLMFGGIKDQLKFVDSNSRHLHRWSI